MIKCEILCGDSTEKLKEIADNSVDLIFTSPPYADRRKNTYGGIAPDRYVDWFLPISKELYRVLKHDGTFMLNIKEQTDNGQRNLYVSKLKIAMVELQGWLWTEEYIWHKTNCYPGWWPNRFRDAWEHLFQFNKNRQFNMYQKEVMVPIGDWINKKNSLKINKDKIVPVGEINDMKFQRVGESNDYRRNSKNGSGFGTNICNWEGKKMVYPTDVLQLHTESTDKNHSATFPDALPEWFIKLFTKKGDLVLDPFAGSGTTMKVAKKMHRNSVGIEILPEYAERIQSDLDKLMVPVALDI